MKLLLSLLCVAVGVLCLYATQKNGVVLTPDSAAYFSTAEGLAGGLGATTSVGVPWNSVSERAPILYWPPAYPAVLAVGLKLGVPAADFARFLNALAFGLTIFLIGLVVLDCTSSRVWALAACIAAASSTAMLLVYTAALSESLFITLAALAMFLAVKATTMPGKVMVLAAGVASALCVLSRYVGLAVILTCLVFLMLDPRARLSIRARNVVLYLAAACLPVLFWLMRNYSLSGTLTGDRAAGRADPALGSRAADIISRWYLPGRVPVGLRITFVLIVAGFITALVFLVLVKSAGKKTDGQMDSAAARWHRVSIWGIFFLMYLLILIASNAMRSFTQLIDERYLAPLFLSLAILLPCGLAEAFTIARGRTRSRGLRYVMISLLIVWLGWSCYSASTWIARLRITGGGYSTETWRNSPIIAWAKSVLGPNAASRTVCYSNAPDALYLLADVSCRYIPYQGESQDLAAFRRAVVDHSGLIIYLNAADWRSYLISEEAIAEEGQFTVLRTFTDGTVFGRHGD